MQIIALHCQNYKRLSAVSIRPDGALVEITGRNAQGKSSVLDAIWSALGGGNASPREPIREGAERADVTVDLGDLVATRTWKGGKSELIVTDRDGAKIKSPQAVLDRLLGGLSFDPLAFARLGGTEPGRREQAAILRRIVGIDTRVLDDERAKVYDLRTAAGRELRAAEVLLAEAPVVDAPAHEVSVAELAREHRARSDVRARNEGERRRAADLRRRFEAALERVEQIKRQLAEARQEAVRFEAATAQAEAGVATLVDPDLDEIARAMGEAEDVNRRVRARGERLRRESALDDARARHDALEARIAAIDEEKRRLLAGAKFPLDGLGVDDTGVRFRGVPLAQASSAEQLRVSLAIGAALAPTLKVLLVREGSLLDPQGLEWLATWAEQAGLQLWVERVAGDGEPVGVVIEDGHVAAVRPRKRAARKPACATCGDTGQVQGEEAARRLRDHAAAVDDGADPGGSREDVLRCACGARS